MEPDIPEQHSCTRNNRQRRRTKLKKKLPTGQKVEVRSEEDGFLGSWHKGSVVRAGFRRRKIEYNHLLSEDGSGYNLTVDVVVSAAMDGENLDVVGFYSGRGLIRPLPPRCSSPGPWELPYGLCVDVYYKEAWWEGVIFDHNDGENERRVFFPDLGDEMVVAISSMRVTMTWNDIDGSWLRRGTWVLLELLEGYEKDGYLAVSVQQIWYDLRERDEFQSQIVDWTCSDEAAWKDLVKDTIINNLTIALGDVFLLSSCENTTDSNVTKPPLAPLFGPDNLIDRLAATCSVSGLLSPVTKKRKNGLNWEPVSPEMLTGAEARHGVMTKYALRVKGQKKRDALARDVRKFLINLGWQINFTKDGDTVKYQYIEPCTRRSYISLKKLCKDFIDLDKKKPQSIESNQTRSLESKQEDEKTDGESDKKRPSGTAREQKRRRKWPEEEACKSSVTTDELVSWKPRNRTNSTNITSHIISLQQDNESNQMLGSMNQRTDSPNPKTVLSWLIDEKTISGGDKVYYRIRRNSEAWGEGWVSHHGIRCRCCNTVFTLRGFSLHVGNTHQRAASSIFLEDGRSLLDCQTKLLHDKLSNRKIHGGENDCICSVCHNGGKLILCDCCPSSYHKRCLNLLVCNIKNVL